MRLLVAAFLCAGLTAQALPVAGQQPDGRWLEVPATEPLTAPAAVDPGDVRATSAVMLACLAEHSTLRRGPHRSHLKLATLWLRSQQDEATGRVGGTKGVDAGLCAYALAAAYQLSQYRTLKPIARSAVACAIAEQERADPPDPVAAALALLAARTMQEAGSERLRERALARVRAQAPPSAEWLGLDLLLHDLASAATRDEAEVYRCAALLAAAELACDGVPRDELTLALATTALYRVRGVEVRGVEWDVWTRKLAKHFEQYQPVATSTTARALRGVTMSLYYRIGWVYGESGAGLEEGAGPMPAQPESSTPEIGPPAGK